MTPSREDVLAAVRASFPEDARPRILQLLDAYGAESSEQGRSRVQLAILTLSMGSEEKLKEYLAVAKRDYRDVLFWAECPEEARIDTPEKKRRVIDALKKLGVDPPPGLAE